MRILLLGGSNAGVKEGWATQFDRLAAGHHVENRFLGAVGSLYGLMALMKIEREQTALPDLVILEYCLNDILLHDAGVARLSLVIDTLRAIADFCARKRIALLFLNLEPRPTGNPGHQRVINRISSIYARVAEQRNVSCLWLGAVFPEGLKVADFKDENHLSDEAARRVATALAEAVQRGVPAPAPGTEKQRFQYVDATQAIVSGPANLQTLDSRVFRGAFLDIQRGGASSWRGHGSLVALMLQSNDKSGPYSIRTDGKAVRKTSRSGMQSIVRKLMLLHYVAGDIRVRGEVEIAMPNSEADLLRMPVNRGPLEGPPLVAFEEQALAIHGVIFWSSGYLARLRDLLLMLI